MSDEQAQPEETSQPDEPKSISAGEFIVAVLIGEGIIRPDDAARAVELVEKELASLPATKAERSD